MWIYSFLNESCYTEMYQRNVYFSAKVYQQISNNRKHWGSDHIMILHWTYEFN